MTRSVMRWGAVAAAVLFAPFAWADSPPPAISVSGEATLSVAPDFARIEAGVISEARTAREASDANNAAMGKVLLALKSAGMNDKDYQTSQLSLQPRYAPNPAPNTSPQVTGYRASNRVTVKVTDVTRVATMLDMLVAAGANDIGGIAFGVANPSALLDDARSRALLDARRKAEIYARAAGVALGDPLSISEDGAPGPVSLARMRTAAAPAAIAVGEETLRVGVNVSWAIKRAMPPEPPPPTPPLPIPQPSPTPQQ